MSSYDLLMPGLIAKTGVLKNITLESNKWEGSSGNWTYSYERPSTELNEYSTVIVSPNLYKDYKVNYRGISKKDELNYVINFVYKGDNKPGNIPPASPEGEPPVPPVTLLILLKSNSQLESISIEKAGAPVTDHEEPEWQDYQYTNDWYNIKGMRFIAHYNTGNTKDVTKDVTSSIKIGKWEGTEGTQTATFTYSDGVLSKSVEKTCNKIVRKLERLVVEGSLENQWLNKEPTLKGLTFTAYYNNSINGDKIGSESIRFTPEIWDKHSKLQALNLSYTESGITASYKRNYNILPKPEDLNVITSENVKNPQFYLDRVDFTGSYVVVKFSDDSIRIFHIDNNTDPGVITETEVHFIGGQIFYEDESVDNGLTYTFYDMNGNIVSSIDNPFFYSTSGTRINDRDKYFVYYNKDLNNFLSMKKDWGYYTKSVGCSFTIGKENLKRVEDFISEGDPVTKDSIWDYLINTHNFNNAEGCDDWYIGSKSEIDKLREVLVDLSNIWSSQESDSSKSYKLNSEGSWEESSKIEKASFIPIRSF